MANVSISKKRPKEATNYKLCAGRSKNGTEDWRTFIWLRNDEQKIQIFLEEQEMDMIQTYINLHFKNKTT